MKAWRGVSTPCFPSVLRTADLRSADLRTADLRSARRRPQDLGRIGGVVGRGSRGEEELTGVDVLPSYLNPAGLSGASEPTNDITVAPSHPAGIRLRVGCAGSLSRIFTRRPLTETTVICGGKFGTGCGEGSPSGTTIPSSIFAAAVTAVFDWICL